MRHQTALLPYSNDMRDLFKIIRFSVLAAFESCVADICYASSHLFCAI
ncbi:MAG: hypothetical protein REV36_03145 [Burkholderia sp.]|nr:hypothetical protein [Burkholderia sp.]